MDGASMVKQVWWELLDEDEAKELGKYYPDYKKYEVPTLDMRWIIDSFNEYRYRKRQEEKN